jgi:hypothetical protein
VQLKKNTKKPKLNEKGKKKNNETPNNLPKEK